MNQPIMPTPLVGCTSCTDFKHPVSRIETAYYGVNGWDYRSMLTLQGKVPTDSPIDCATQAAFDLTPAALV